MSTYQLYKFQAIDRPLTDKEQRIVSNLSSRVDPHPRRATFLYNYGDFPADPQDLMAKYFDAMFYIANWGTSRLMFRFPRHLVDVRHFEPYYVEDHITWEWSGDHLILDIHLWAETWRQVEALIEEGRVRPYGEAVDLLLKLRDLADYQDKEAAFAARLAAIRSAHARRNALLRRLDEAGLP